MTVKVRPKLLFCLLIGVLGAAFGITSTIQQIDVVASDVGSDKGHQSDAEERDVSILEPKSKLAVDQTMSNDHVFSGVVETSPSDVKAFSNSLNRGTTTKATNSTDTLVSVNTQFSDQNEPTVSIEPRSGHNRGSERLVAGANDYRSGDAQCGIYTSRNGGKTWHNGGVLPGPFTSADGTLLPVQGDPVVRHSRNGDVFYSCLAFSRSEGSGSVFISRSTNHGSTWSLPIPVRQGSTREFNDKPWLAVDQSARSPFKDNVYLCWTQFVSSDGTINFAKSMNLKYKFSSQIILSTSKSNQGCTIDVALNGTIFVAWIDLASSQLMVVKSTDGGETFSCPVMVNNVFRIPSPLPNNNFRVFPLPSMAIAKSGNVYIVWPDDRFRASGFGSDILMATSTDGGNSWTTKLVNTGDRTNTDQFFPTIDISYNQKKVKNIGVGTIVVFYYDKRYGLPFNTMVDVTEAYSTESADTFSLHRITYVSSDLNSCSFSHFVGDYIDVRANRATHGVWTDCRDTTQINQEIFTDKVTH